MREKHLITRAPSAFCHILEPAPQGMAGAGLTWDPQDYKALMGELSIYPTLTPSWGFPSGSVEKNSPANARDASLIPGSGRSLGGGNGNPLQYSCLGNFMDRETWEATVHGTTELDRTERLSTSSHIGISEVIVISPGNLDSSL